MSPGYRFLVEASKKESLTIDLFLLKGDKDEQLKWPICSELANNSFTITLYGPNHNPQLQSFRALFNCDEVKNSCGKFSMQREVMKKEFRVVNQLSHVSHIVISHENPVPPLHGFNYCYHCNVEFGQHSPQSTIAICMQCGKRL